MSHLPQPNTVLRNWDKARKADPALTTEQMAIRMCMPHKVFLAKLQEAQYIFTKRQPPIQAGAVTTFELDALEDGWSQSFLLQSDNHHDSIVCNRRLEQEHLEEAIKRRAIVMMFGDILDAMQGRFDPRRSMAGLRPEYRREDYYDFVVRDCVDWFGPYAPLIGIMADGNHELAVLKNANTDLLGRLVEALNERGGQGNIKRGGYGGWVHLVFNLGNKKVLQRIKYFHGSGGEAPVTRGAIQTNRQAVYLPDADIVVNGHSHNHYYITICRERTADDGRHYFHLQHHLRIPGYNQAYGDGMGGWEVTRGGTPKPIGAIWLKFERVRDDIRLVVESDIQPPDVVSIDPNELYSGKVYDQDGEGV